MKLKLDGRIFSLICIVLFGLTPVLWFLGLDSQVLIDGVDINFPLDPWMWFERRLFVWNSLPNAGGDFSSSTSGSFFHLIQVIPYLLGFSLQTVQLVSFLFWFLTITILSLLFSSVVFPKKYLLQILFVTLYVFNIYLFNTWENIKVANLALLSAIPLSLWIYLKLSNNQINISSAILYSSINGIILSGAGINPAYFISFFGTLVIFYIGDLFCNFSKDSFIKKTFSVFVIGSSIVLINSFWLIPTINYILQSISSSSSITSIGFTNWLQGLSENTSMVNLFRIQGAWDWYTLDEVTKEPVFIPYASNYFYNYIFIIFSFLVPSLAFAAFIFKRKENINLYISFGVMLIVGLFLAAGSHPPTGSLFLIFAEKIPFFSLFRSPWYIFTPMVILAISGLVCLFFQQLPNLQIKRFKLTLNNVFVISLIVLNLIYCYPLTTGKIFRPNRPDGFYITFPEYILSSKEILGENSTGRLIAYPDDQLENYRWGYRGLESITQLFSNKEVLFNPINGLDLPISKMVNNFYLYLKKNQIESASNLAQKMAIDRLLYRRDQISNVSDLTSEFRDYPIQTSEEWDSYTFPKEPVEKIHSVGSFVTSKISDDFNLLSVVNADQVLINGKDSVIRRSEIDQHAIEVVPATNVKSKEVDNFYTHTGFDSRMDISDVDTISYKFKIEKESYYQPILEKYHLSEHNMADVSNLEVFLNNQKITLIKDQKTSDSYIYFRPILLARGDYSLDFKINSQNLFPGFKQSKEDQLVEKNILAETENLNDDYLELVNLTKEDLSADVKISPFDPLSIYYIQLQYQQSYGEPGFVEVIQNRNDKVLRRQKEIVPSYPEWIDYGFYFTPAGLESEMKLQFTAPASKGKVESLLGSTLSFRNISVKRVFTNKLLLLEEEKEQLLERKSPKVEYKKISSVLYEGSIEANDQDFVLVFSENYSKNWQIELSDGQGYKLLYKPNHFTANMYANGWILSSSSDGYKFRITYAPQNLYFFGSVVSLTYLGFIILFFIFKKLKK